MKEIQKLNDILVKLYGTGSDELEQFLIENNKRVHNNALKMVEDGLPKQYPLMITKDEMMFEDGYNRYRDEVINNIQKLKI